MSSEQSLTPAEERILQVAIDSHRSEHLSTPVPATENLGRWFDRIESTKAAVGRQALEESLAEAEGWTEHGYSAESRAYWAGVRDTLRVVLGLTTEVPHSTGPGSDVAAVTILGAQRRAKTSEVH